MLEEEEEEEAKTWNQATGRMKDWNKRRKKGSTSSRKIPKDTPVLKQVMQRVAKSIGSEKKDD